MSKIVGEAPNAVAIVGLAMRTALVLAASGEPVSKATAEPCVARGDAGPAMTALALAVVVPLTEPSALACADLISTAAPSMATALAPIDPPAPTALDLAEA